MKSPTEKPSRNSLIAIFSPLTLLLFLSSVSGWAAMTAYEIHPEKSKIQFNFDSTLHGIEGEAKEFHSEIQYDPEQNILSLPAEVTIPVSSLRTGNWLRDKDMKRMFKAKDYPFIYWKMTAWDCTPFSTEKTTVCTGEGTLTIRDISQKITLPITLSLDSEGPRAVSSVKINLADFKLKPPSVLGIIKVDKEIHINFETLWTEKNS